MANGKKTAQEQVEGRTVRVPLERPVQVLKLTRLTHVYIRLQQAQDHRHGCLIVAKAAQARHHHVVQV